MRSSVRSRLLRLCAFVLLAAWNASCQTPPAPGASSFQYPKVLPYRFSNFVWWSDDDLRVLLKKRIAGLSDEIAPNRVAEGRLRDALKALLNERGVVAEIQSTEPSEFQLTGQRTPEAPPPSIVFSILYPRILIDHVVAAGFPEETKSTFEEKFKQFENRPFSSGSDWMIKMDCQDALSAAGYLDSKVEITHSPPSRSPDGYLVNLSIVATAGPKYHIGALSADGGLLLNAKDLSQFFEKKVGDFAGANPFSRLTVSLRMFYWRAGYADVQIGAVPVLDRERALASYHLTVTPGPLYHLRSLTVHKLDDAQESKVRDFLAMKPGDIYDGSAVDRIYHKLPSEPSLSAYSFTFSPSKDARAGQVDLSLDFFKKSDESSVTVK